MPDQTGPKQARFTPSLTVEEVLEHGVEIAKGINRRCKDAVNHDRMAVVCSVLDLMFLVDAYREALWALEQQATEEEANGSVPLHLD